MKRVSIITFLPVCRGAFIVRTTTKEISTHPLSVYKRIRHDGASITSFDTPERRVAGRKIVNIEYHKIDWAKNFAAGRKTVGI